MEGISIIIPNYNKEKYIEKCVDSVLKQSYMPKEIIIVDDCSTDNSRRTIEKLAKKNETIKLIYPKTNGGVSKARNLGLQNASYDYVTFIDSDDFYINVDKLKNEMKQLKLLEEKGYQGLAYSTTVLVDEDGKVIPCRANRRRRKNEFMKGNRVLKTLISLSKQKIIPRDYCIRKETVLKVGAYNYPRNFYEDLDLLMRLAMAGVFFQPTYENGTAYRQLQNGLSGKNTIEHNKEIEIICSHYMKDLKFSDRIIATYGQKKTRLKKKIVASIKKIL